MNKKSLGVLLLAAGMIGLFGCSEHSPSGIDSTQKLTPESGRFGMSSLGKLEKRTRDAAVEQGAQVKFNLGKIRGSSGFFFLLYNVGVTPITNVTLSIDNKAFSVFPTSIDTLIPSSDVGMLPIVKIAAFHGTPYDGVGNRPLLPQGKNDGVLHIQGTSKTASGADTTIEMDAVMSLEALVMGLSVDGMNGALDISKTLNMSDPSEVSKDFQSIKELKTLVSTRTECIGDSIVTIRNTGNVTIHCTVLRSVYQLQTGKYSIDTTSDSSVAAQGTMNVVLNGKPDSVAYLAIVSGDNAVSDPLKTVLNDNGKFYARLVKGAVPCADAQVQKRYEKFLSDRSANNSDKIWAFLENRVIIYTEKFIGSDSIKSVLYDLYNDTLLTSLSGSGYILNQDNDYNGEYLGVFTKIVESMFTLGGVDKTYGLDPQRITGGGKSNWVITTPEPAKIILWQYAH